jgi:hypothetical protein
VNLALLVGLALPAAAPRVQTVQEAKLLASDGDERDFAGESVSLSGERALVSARGDDDQGEDSGSAYVYRLEEGPTALTPASLHVTVSTAYNPTPAAHAPAGVYTIQATFTNISASTLTDLLFQVHTLSGGNVLLNALGGPAGVGAQVAGPEAVAPGESFAVSFEIGLARRQPFRFLVDAFAFVSAAAAGEVGGPVDRFHFEVEEGDLQRALEPHLFLPFIRR